MFAILDTDTGATATDPTTRIGRTYQEQSGSVLTVDVSFNNGGTFNTVNDGSLFLIAPIDQGSQFIIRFTNGGSDKRWVGSWAVIF